MKSVRFLSQSVSHLPLLWAAQKAAFRRTVRQLPTALACFVALQGNPVQAAGPVGGVILPPPGPYDPTPPISDPCRNADPHRIFYVPDHFGSVEFPSGSGGYHYLKDQNKGCDRWVVDIKMATYSNMNSPYMSPGTVIIGAIPYDLPGSKSFGGITPVTQEDCERLTLSTTIYQKLSGETEFTRIHTTTSKGQWQFGQCRGVASGQFDVRASKSGWDTYRVATKLKERSSAQEVSVFIDQPPPE